MIRAIRGAVNNWWGLDGRLGPFGVPIATVSLGRVQPGRAVTDRPKCARRRVTAAANL